MTNKIALKILKMEKDKLMSKPEHNRDWELITVLDIAIEVLENEPKKGKWIIAKQDFEGIHEIECPFCKYNKGSDFNALITVTFDRLPPFCENCGADMREVDNDDKGMAK